MACPKRAQSSVQQSAAPEKLGDLRFRALLSDEEWAALPRAVRRRFSKRVNDGKTIVYVGKLTEVKFSRLGRWIAQALRLMGAPLPVRDDIDVPTVVTVTEDIASRGQNWTRLYANRRGFPQTINSTKRFSGPTGLEEYIGFGVSIALAVSVEDSALVFRSAGYRIGLGWMRLSLPKSLWPGALAVKHEEISEDLFRFSMLLEHPLLGQLLYQVGEYEEDLR
ncbi:MAG: DUF4166 domain-containing protein [Pseudomonadota bacterium]